MSDAQLVADFFKQNFAGEEIYYVTNQGNAGDALIGYGALSFFEREGIRFHFVESPRDPVLEGKVVVYAGGGYLTDFYPHNAENLSWMRQHAKHLVMLPQTTQGSEEFLASLGSETTVFCRELVTYEHVQKHTQGVAVHLVPDMAFCIPAKAFVEQQELQFPQVFKKFISQRKQFGRKSSRTVRGKYLYRAFRHDLRYRKKAAKAGHPKRLNAFRYDQEASGISIPDVNIDVSYSMQFGVNSAEKLEYTSFRFLSFINKFEEVYTDRLHVAIGAAMLGKKVYLYSNSYFKCRAIFEYSLQKQFPDVVWMGSGND
ncbi:polysaccharide pyruvyl transferase family protein [Aliagarivorans taiwanensis]|uniref:polysaccharide pyruvyl transferase family protein n=1 Tax=Aliagarivorans taiwanensis TaxID=561966 RepID=UPI000402A2F7|nr:polysaccharide pyruvyl transferase family protein [Aliagarivorans taiwanensis]